MTLTHDNRNNQRGTQDEVLAQAKGTTHIMSRTTRKRGYCRKCGAWKGELVLEPTPELYVEHLVEIFREIRRVLKPMGTCWLVIGDSYAGGGRAGNNPEYMGKHKMFGKDGWDPGVFGRPQPVPSGLKPKDLVGIPWRIAFALQKDGWWLRQDIIWSKPSCMPESIKDRCTRAHEYIFLLTKSAKYYYDADAIRENATTQINDPRNKRTKLNSENAVETKKGGHNTQCGTPKAGKRNKRSVWTINTEPYPEAHFAVFPSKIPELCIKAGAKRGDVVLDPFAGSGTTGMVAKRLGREYILIELQKDYLPIIKKRLNWQQADLFEYQGAIQ